MKKYIFLITFASAISCSAQNLIVDANELGTQQYNLNTLQKITFTNDSMQIHLQSGQLDSWAKTDVRFMVFEDNPLYQKDIENLPLRNIKVYPTPTEGFLTVEWITSATGMTNFELMDLNGRIVYRHSATVSYMGKQTAKFDLSQSLSNGVYFLKVNQNKTISYRKVIIQK